MATPAPSPLPKQDVLARLKAGVNSWNSWRQTISDEDWEQCDLSGADLEDMDLTEADLAGVKLCRTRLRNAAFTRADLYETDLREANLQDADLSEVKGALLPRQFAGADLTGAKLPEPLTKFYDKSDLLTKISDAAKATFLALLTGSLYCLLTVKTAKDIDLVADRASSPLPVIQAAIPIAGFYLIAPVILLSIYFYFHFYLQKLWDALGSLPAVFPTGESLDTKLDPWLMNDIVRSRFINLKENRPFLSHFQKWASIVLAWWMVPITLFLFWYRYIPRHDLLGAQVLAVLVTISVVCAIQLYRLAKGTLRSDPRTPFTLKGALRRRRTYTDWARAIFVGGALVLIAKAAIQAPRLSNPWTAGPASYADTVRKAIDHWRFANLEDSDISLKPPNWTGQTPDQYDLVKGWHPVDIDLRNASAGFTFLVNSNLAGLHMEAIDLTGADLRKTNLLATHLENAHLEHAHLQYAFGQGAFMSGATLSSADLTRADFAGVDLTNAIVDSNTNIKYTNLRRAKGVTSNTINKCTNWQLAFLDDKLLKELGISDPPKHNDDLQKQMKAEEAQTKSTLPSNTEQK